MDGILLASAKTYQHENTREQHELNSAPEHETDVQLRVTRNDISEPIRTIRVVGWYRTCDILEYGVDIVLRAACCVQ